MNKRKLTLLGALLALSMTSMASVIPLEETKGETVVDGRVTDRLGRQRTEMQINKIWLSDRNRLDIEFEQNNYDGDIADEDRSTFVQFELFTQLGDSGRFELYTDFKPYNNAGTNSTTGYLDVMPTLVISRTENFESVLRAGVGYDQGKVQDGVNQTRAVGEFKNYWTVNDWLGLEANAYAWNMNDTGYQKVEVEAYWYTNYNLFTTDNGITIDFLTEGGLDPYTFADREYKNAGGQVIHETDLEDDYYFYFQPTVKINVPISDGKYNVYFEPGYYMEANGGAASTSKSSDEGMFMRAGFSTKF
jgi:hypothetical protein